MGDSHHHRSRRDCFGDDRFDRPLFDIRQHLDDDLAAAPDHPQNGRLLLLQRAASAFALRSSSASGTAFFDRFGMTLVPSDYVDLGAFVRASERRLGLEIYDATAQERGHLMRVVLVEIEFLRDLLVHSRG